MRIYFRSANKGKGFSGLNITGVAAVVIVAFFLNQ